MTRRVIRYAILKSPGSREILDGTGGLATRRHTEKYVELIRQSLGWHRAVSVRVEVTLRW